MKKIISFFFLFSILFLFPFSAFAKEDDNITLYLFHGDGCPHCAEEINYLSSIENNYDNLKIVKYEVWYNQENADFLREILDAFDIDKTGVPVTIIGDSVIFGFGNSMESKIIRAIEYYEENEYTDFVSSIKDGTFEKDRFKEKIDDESFSKSEKESDQKVTIDIPFIGNINLKNVSLMSAAVIIGLIDGFNPCAMWILLFLISVLIGMKNRRRMWGLGFTFLFTSALVYFLIMLSWITIAVKMTTIIWIRNIIAIVAFVGGIVNLKSFIKSRDSGCEVVDDKRRKKIFSRIKKFTREKSFFVAVMGIIGLAISVNLVELACSAGLPLIFSELLALNNITGIMKVMYTLLYILFFLLDDFIVFFIAMFTMKITGISTKYSKFSHLLGGIIMILIGILLFLKPEWLMFHF